MAAEHIAAHCMERLTDVAVDIHSLDKSTVVDCLQIQKITLESLRNAMLNQYVICPLPVYGCISGGGGGGGGAEHVVA